MSTVAEVAAPAPEAETPAGRRFDRALWWDLAAAAGYVAMALYVSFRVVAGVGTRLVNSVGGFDQVLFEWMLAHAARSVTHLENPFYTDRLNVPDGVNLMANTSVLGLGIPMTPVTLLFGPHVSYVVVLVGSMAATAWAWYFLLSRHLVRSRVAAVLGGAFCAFAPGLISTAIHLHVLAQFLVPFIVLAVVRLREPGRSLRNGVILGLLVSYQTLIGEEILLFTAMACGVFVVAWAVVRPAEAFPRLRPFATGLGVAALVSVVLLAYPLYIQFLGPQHSRGLPFQPRILYADLASYTAYARESIAGDAATSGPLVVNESEETAFFGWPLVIFVVGIVVFLWREALVRALALTAAVFVLLSFGERIVVNGVDTGLAGPYRLFDGLPLMDLAIPTRLVFVVIPIVGILLALAADRVTGAGSWRPLWIAAFAAVLVPVAPTPLPVVPAPQVPRFIADGAWRDYVADGRTVVPVPLTRNRVAMTDGMAWSADTGVAFPIPRGYFIGPNGGPDRQATFNPPPRPTSTLLERVATTGVVPEITDEQRRAAVEDLRFWRAGVVVLGPHPYRAQLAQTVDALLGPGRDVDDVRIWTVP